MAHTPTPWNFQHARPFDGLRYPDFGVRIYAEDPGPENDFTIGFTSDADTKTREDNARLIVRAVNAFEPMREALEIIAGKRQCANNLMSDKDVATAALALADKGGE